MMKADQFIKDSRFAEAKAEVQKAKAFDPSNVYINAFIDRINYFEEQKKAESAKKGKESPGDAAPTASAERPMSAVPPAQNKKVQDETPAVKKDQLTSKPASGPPSAAVKKETALSGSVAAAVKQDQPPPEMPKKTVAAPPVKSEPAQPDTIRPIPVESTPVKTEKIESPPKAALPNAVPPIIATPAVKPTPPVPPANVPGTVKPKIDAGAGSVPPTILVPPPKPPVPLEKKPPVTSIPSDAPAVKTEPGSGTEASNARQGRAPSTESPAVKPSSESIYDRTAEKQITAQQLAAMKKQIEKLSLALEQEKIAREEMHQQKVQQNIPIFRAALQNAWIDGAPSDDKKTELQDLARSMAIPDALCHSLQREVKIEMYGKAVKEVIAKRRAIRHSSSTLDWLRKVYQITMEEYVEYESKFLLDLVADQYKGVVLCISSDEETRANITRRLKSAGFAVIMSRSPEDALEKIDQLNPNLILCESSFGPGSITGIKFLHILRRNSKFNFVPFILLSTVEDRVLLAAAEFKPNEGFLVKPVDDDELAAMMNSKLTWFKEYVLSLSE